MPPAGPGPWVKRLMAVAAFVLLRVIMLWGRTLRFAAVVGAERLEPLIASGEPVIFAFWHNRLYVCGLYLRRLTRERGLELATLASHSRDGELVTRMALAEGFRVVRGSTSRGGLGGLLQLYRKLARERVSVITAPDGPRGPAYRAQPGTAMLARSSGAPIVPLAYAAERPWRLRSWDRLILPRPFSRVAVAVGEPLAVAADLPDAGLAAESERLGRRLDSLVEAAEEALSPSPERPATAPPGSS